MKLRKSTVDTLKNFADVSDHLLIKPGKFQNTIALEGTTYLEAEFEDEFPSKFPLYHLSNFLGIFSQLKDPELKFKDAYVEVSDGDVTVNYMYADEHILKVPDPKRQIVIPEPIHEFDLDWASLSKIRKVADAMALTQFTFYGDSSGYYIKAEDPSDETTSNIVKRLGDYDGTEYKLTVSTAYMTLVPADYKVKVGENFMEFKGTDRRYVVVKALPPKK